MSDVTTTVRELRRDDMVRFPDGNGGQVWAPVIRVLPADGHLMEVMFGTAARASYKTLAADRAIVRRERAGETS